MVSTEITSRPPVQFQSQSPAGPSFDPLDVAGHLICGQAIMALGKYLESRNYCPLCEVEQNLGRGFSREWIEVNADTVLEICRTQPSVGSN